MRPSSSESARVASYRLSAAADRDLEALFEFGIDRWGETAARQFLGALLECFAEIAANPLAFAAVTNIHAGYRRRVFRAHSIYYRLDGSDVEIIRVLGRQDPNAQLRLE